MNRRLRSGGLIAALLVASLLVMLVYTPSVQAQDEGGSSSDSGAAGSEAGGVLDVPVGAITFSEFPSGTHITNQYVNRGIVFGGDDPYITADGSNPTSPVLSGTPLFTGAIEGKFVNPADGVTPRTVSYFSIDVGYCDDIGVVRLEWFNTVGVKLGEQLNSVVGIERFASYGEGIARWRISLTAPDAFGIDNVTFPPFNDEIAWAKVIATLPYNDSVNTTWATTAAADPVLPCGPGNQGYHSVWYRFQPVVSGVASVNTSTSTYDTVLAVWRGSHNSPSSVWCNDDAIGLQSALDFAAHPGETYYIEVAGYSAASVGTLNLGLSFEPSIFVDVPVDGKEWMMPWIESFYDAGITTGCGTNPLMYCPERQVTRAEMAVFILRAQHYPALPHDPANQSGTFADMPVAGKEWMEEWVEEFYDLGITTGCNASPLMYCPERQVTRAEMAVFVLRALYGGSHVPPPVSGTFADVPAVGKDWMEPWIEQFYDLGITTGCGTDTDGHLLYCPERPVTRAEMAVFILRAFDGIPSPAP